MGERYSSISEVDMDSLSPMMRHYIETRQTYPDCILFYRLGDFYEMFFEDAITVSKELELTLTGKACGLEARAAMCGVPYHAAETYITRLTDKGYKVAICEQLEDPKLAKGIVKRDVIKIVTPGTNLNTDVKTADRHNYIMCIYYQPDITGIAVADISTGDFLLTQVENIRLAMDELMKYEPSEIIVNEAFMISGADIYLIKDKVGSAVFPVELKLFDFNISKNALTEHFKVNSLDALGIDEFVSGVSAAGALLQYMQRLQKSELSSFTGIYPYLPGKFMLLDTTARRNLELTETLRDKTRKGTLLWVLDKTCTAMGGRALREWIEQPLIDVSEIRLRQNAVEALLNSLMVREEIRACLNEIYDLERLMARISYHSAGPKEILQFGSSIKNIPPVLSLLKELSADEELRSLYKNIDPLDDLNLLIEASINIDAPLSARDGNVIKSGYNEDIDNLRTAERNGRQWLLDFEEEAKSRTGIKNLKLKYVGNFGYVIEVTKSNTDKVPDDFIRRQTLTNCERYTTVRLKELEDIILNSRERLFTLEYDVFCDVRDIIGGCIKRVQTTAKALSRLDALISLAHTADSLGYVKPEISDGGIIEIKDGRHPVVEKILKASGGFITNDTLLDMKENNCLIITGPNMAGKSTYMRQTALIVLMAQIGSFVPASSANIGIVDRIFTRVGASDDLASGRSTFMVEMSEVAQILRNATKKSLLILDEIGRGTSTSDGLSIAWAVAEYVSDKKRLGARTLFATHYHELTELEGSLEGVKNLRSTVKETESSVVFLHKIVSGGADKSYGIQVARIAGVPEEVTERAKEINRLLEANENDKAKVYANKDLGSKNTEKDTEGQLSFLDMAYENETVRKIREVNINSMTPVDALNFLYELQNEVKK